MSKYVIDSSTLVSIGDAVRDKEGTTAPILVSDLADRISAIETGGGAGGYDIPDSAFTITGDCNYRFAYNGWNWFIDNYGHKITTKNLGACTNLFDSSGNLTEVPFDLNFRASGAAADNMFRYCTKLKVFPKMIGGVNSAAYLFNYCYCLREVTEEMVKDIDWSYIDNGAGGSYSGNRGNTFQNCYSLRSIYGDFLKHGNPNCSYMYSIYYYLFNNCYVLDGVELPLIHRESTWTSNAFNTTFIACYRLKDLIFETNEDGSPIAINGWSKQTIDLSQNTGYCSSYAAGNIWNYNSGITKDKQVTDDATYQALKNDPDWFTADINYSRYNHDSAVETINSLPDLSGGAGSNTIKFKGAAGAKTDGGAINTMTEAEIAVATAKGWTVTYA